MPLLLVSGFACKALFSGSCLQLFLKLILACLCHLLNFTFGLQRPSAVEMSEICEKNNRNVAHGLAWSYYVGYLKFVLPRLKDLISEFNRDNKNLLACKETWKLHILLPLSCEIYNDLEKADSHIQYCKDLPELVLDRAGTKRRVYKQSIYGVMGEDKKLSYCVVEYATPLQSLYAMSQDESAAFSRQDRLEQAQLFCRTLEEILQSSKECAGCYRLVVYEGEENLKWGRRVPTRRKMLNLSLRNSSVNEQFPPVAVGRDSCEKFFLSVQGCFLSPPVPRMLGWRKHQAGRHFTPSFRRQPAGPHKPCSGSTVQRRGPQGLGFPGREGGRRGPLCRGLGPAGVKPARLPLPPRQLSYCVVEYATPLQSLYAMSQDESAAFSRQDRLEQAQLFCRTLEEILQSSKECAGCYRLVVYEDSGDSNSHFLSKELLRHIRQQHLEEYAMCNGSHQPATFLSEEPVIMISNSELPGPLRSDGF
nr:stimulator of interferon genes protein [Pelodiscus sinensis]|eukprot:XP_025044135.1 stimulator of interferon genes protein [Pelodiscus sinensis]